jgi:hypothetical protein
MLNVVIKAKLFFPLGPLQNCTFRQTFSTFHLQKSTFRQKCSTFGVQNENNDRFVRRTSHTSLGIPGLESDDGDVGHTPIFSQSVLVRKSDVVAHILFYYFSHCNCHIKLSIQFSTGLSTIIFPYWTL